VSDDNVFWMVQEEPNKELRVGGVLRIGGETISPIVKSRVSTALYFKDSQGMPILADPIADYMTNRLWTFYDKNQGRLILVMGINEQSVLNPGNGINRTIPLDLFYACNNSLNWMANLPAIAGFSGGGEMTKDQLERWFKAGSEVYSQGYEDQYQAEFEDMLNRLNPVLIDTFGGVDFAKSPFLQKN